MPDPSASLETFIRQALGASLWAFGLHGTVEVRFRRGPGRPAFAATVAPSSGAGLELKRWRQVAAGLQALADAALALRGGPEVAVEVVLAAPSPAPAGGEVEEDGWVTAARQAARRAVALGRAFALGPMTSVERRLVHQALSDLPEAWTQSEGEGLYRRLWVIPRSLVDRRPPEAGDRDAPPP